MRVECDVSSVQQLRGQSGALIRGGAGKSLAL
jgi:hypothetical protein